MPQLHVIISAAGHALDSEVLPLDVSLDLTLADLKAYINAETGLDAAKLLLSLDGRPLGGDTTTLTQAGAKGGDMLHAVLAQDQSAQPTPPRGAPSQSTSVDEQIENARQQFLGNRDVLNRIAQDAPDLANAINDREAFHRIYRRYAESEQANRREMQRQAQLMNDDPFNVEAQQKIEEMIRMENVAKNLEYAHEHNPESFGTVTMLYINATVNGHTIKVLVDSGAQMTIMSPSCAESCNIMRLIDTRYAGIARGVGTAKILGRVHSADMQLGNMSLPCSFMVMEGKTVDLLLGLDMLKRYQVSIDLKKNKLVFPNEEIDFLPESEIPVAMEEARAEEPTIPGPDGTEIGTESGVVRPRGSIHHPSGAASQNKAPSAGSTQQVPQSNAQSATGAGPSGSTTHAPSAQASRHPKESIEHLVNLGFSEREAIAALDATDGNLEYAAGLLFGA